MYLSVFAGEFNLAVTQYFVHPCNFRIHSVKEGLVFSRPLALHLRELELCEHIVTTNCNLRKFCNNIIG
jgi:hypothetical protein